MDLLRRKRRLAINENTMPNGDLKSHRIKHSRPELRFSSVTKNDDEIKLPSRIIDTSRYSTSLILQRNPIFFIRQNYLIIMDLLI